jgi:hypothetical protein
MRRLTDIDQAAEKKKNDKKAKVYFAITVGFIGVFVLFFLYLFLFGKMYDYCEHVDEVRKAQFRGIVVDKFFIDMNHNFHSLTIRNEDGREIHLDLSDDWNSGQDDKSKLWLQVNIGDSIAKKENEFQVFYKPSGQLWTSERLKYNNLNKCRD